MPQSKLEAAYTEVGINSRLISPKHYFGGIKRTLQAFLIVACAVLLVNVTWLGYANVKYNSLVFTSLSTNNYYWSIVTEDFLAGAPFNLTGPWVPQYYKSNTTEPIFTATPPNDEFTGLGTLTPAQNMQFEHTFNDYFGNIQQSASSWERLENKDCIQAYSNAFVPSRRNVVLVSSVKNNTNSILKYRSSDIRIAMDSNWWICSKYFQDGGHLTCVPNDYISKAKSWKVFNYPIEYCLSERTPDVCEIKFSMTIMLVVVASNALKVLMMIWVLFRFDAEQILATVGDAAASFLDIEDPTTERMCLANKREMRDFWNGRGTARPFSKARRHWGSAVSKKRWLLFFSSMLFAFGLIGFFAGWGFRHLQSRGIGLDPTSLWSLGFGELNQNALTFVGNEIGTIHLALIANSPQLILSIIYMLYMGITSSMFLAADWSNFAFRPQTLLVSSRRGRQRGTWLFGAPIKWGLASITMQTLLHWFVSQSLFMVQLQVYNKDGSPRGSDYTWELGSILSQVSNCGYSPVAIIFTVVAACVLMLSAVFFMWRRFPAGAPPVVSTCSAAISAACHPTQRIEGMKYGELRWGAVGRVEEGIGHCSLVPAEFWDSGQAHEPVEGVMYAGFQRHEQMLRGDIRWVKSVRVPREL
ncbi:hypothetical protein BKA64DRAFT_693057 [Cadophora sp. MPI-SDFR-AT-0126]|nr:hypothetical protein BKA64DRAFT_693057 [Leotiomycetes sp. MPI-SDFR-AT-0126]